MKKGHLVTIALMVLSLVCPGLPAQEKAIPGAKTPATTLKVQVTISEQDGEKKLANLPYAFYLRAGEGGPASTWTKVRMGSRVPVMAGKDGGMQYIDVGTNIDARAFNTEDGRFDLSLNLERSWVEGDVPLPADKLAGAAQSGAGQFREPIIRQFKTEVSLALRDGQTIQITQATDPLSGRLLTITVTANAVK